MATISDSLLKVLPDLFNDYMNASAPKSTLMAPVLNEDSLALQYLTADTDSIPDARDPVLPSSPSSRYKDVSRNFSRATVDVQIRDGFRAVIPDRVIQSLRVDSAAIDLVDIELRRIVDKHWLAHVANTITTLDTMTATAYGSGTIVLSGTTAPLTAIFRAMLNEIRLANGSSVGCRLYCGVPVFDRLLQQNEIYEQGGIAIGTAGSADVNVKRLGAVDESAVYAFFKRLGIELVVEDFIQKSASAGANENVLSTGLYLAQASDRPNMSAHTTIAQAIEGSDAQYGPFGVEIAPTGVSTGDRRGIAVGVDAAWTIKQWSAARGRKAATTLS